jgi:uncharacterized membrane protein YqjE
MHFGNERSVSEVLRDIFGNLQDIVRSEVRLAKSELKAEAGKAVNAGRPLMAGLVFGLYAGGLLLLAAVRALSLVIEPWLAALAIGAILSVIAAILIGTGRGRMERGRSKSQRTDSMKGNADG